MPKFVIERQYLVPMYQHVVVEADTLEDACAISPDALLRIELDKISKDSNCTVYFKVKHGFFIYFIVMCASVIS